MMSCTTTNDKKAIILERKRIDDSTTHIIYRYHENEATKIDSQTIVNTILPNDTIYISEKNHNIVMKP